MERILIIKLGALGDFILSYRAMTAIRSHHKHAHLSVLTIPSLAPMAKAFGLFDDVWCDDRPGIFQVSQFRALQKRLLGGQFDRIYDLQTADRTGFYFRLLGWPFARLRPEWSGIVRGCSHRHDRADRTTKHTLERQADQLAIAGIPIEDYPPLDFSWVKADVSRHHLVENKTPYVLLVPGGSKDHPQKRWPAGNYAALAVQLEADGFRPVVIGTSNEADACAEIANACDNALNLCGDSPIMEVMALARDAAGAVGNDTGPMHLIAPMGCPCLVLYSGTSNPEMNRPRGPNEGPGRIPGNESPGETVSALRADPLSDLSVVVVRDTMVLR